MIVSFQNKLKSKFLISDSSPNPALRWCLLSFPLLFLSPTSHTKASFSWITASQSFRVLSSDPHKLPWIDEKLWNNPIRLSGPKSLQN